MVRIQRSERETGLDEISQNMCFFEIGVFLSNQYKQNESEESQWNNLVARFKIKTNFYAHAITCLKDILFYTIETYGNAG